MFDDPEWKPFGFRVASGEEEPFEELVPLGTTTLDLRSIPSLPVPKPVKRSGTVTDLLVEEIRWFYLNQTLGKWTPFAGRDSIVLELGWRRLKEVSFCNSFAEFEEDNIAVREGFYTPDFENCLIRPIYEEGDTIAIRRGLWFTTKDWQPLDPSDALLIEHEHLGQFRDRIPPQEGENEENDSGGVINELPLTGNKSAKWFSINTVIYTVPGQVFGMNDLRIERGYHSEASPEDGPPPVTQILFVTHGIAEKIFQCWMDDYISPVLSSIFVLGKDLQKTINRLSTQHFPNARGRIMILPVEWRSKLQLDNGRVDSVTPPHMEVLRELLNSTALDVMYYDSPLYREEIVKSMEGELNRLFRTFLLYNPKFREEGGQISLLAHSLGTVIIYDILEQWSPLRLYDEYVTRHMEELSQDPLWGDMLRTFERGKFEMLEKAGGLEGLLDRRKPALDFKVDNLFLIGSPLGLFLALRGFEGSPPLLKNCPKVFNIFHPNDPISYRIEPLLHKAYEKVNPVRIKTAARGMEPYDFSDLNPVGIQGPPGGTSTTNIMSMVNEAFVKFAGESNPFSAWMSQFLPRPQAPEDAQESVAVQPKLEVPPEAKLETRIDFILTPGKEPAFLAAVFAHNAYWINKDVIMFVLSQIHLS